MKQITSRGSPRLFHKKNNETNWNIIVHDKLSINQLFAKDWQTDECQTKAL